MALKGVPLIIAQEQRWEILEEELLEGAGDTLTYAPSVNYHSIIGNALSQNKEKIRRNFVLIKGEGYCISVGV